MRYTRNTRDAAWALPPRRVAQLAPRPGLEAGPVFTEEGSIADEKAYPRFGPERIRGIECPRPRRESLGDPTAAPRCQAGQRLPQLFPKPK
jgi:hypothetical protein